MRHARHPCRRPYDIIRPDRPGRDFTIETRDQVALRAAPFPLSDVRLLDGPFKRAQDLDRQYLLQIDVDRLLRTFRLNAGLSPTAAAYGGWEKPDCELRGHFAGHFLSACALMYAGTGDERLRRKAAAPWKGWPNAKPGSQAAT